MKKLLTASVASWLLLAGVASAQSDAATIHVGDRLGSASSTANHDQGQALWLLLPVGLLVIIIAAASSSHHHHRSVSP